MIRTYEYRVYPNPQQEELFKKTLGLCRLYWNVMLEAKQNDNSAPIEGYKQVFSKYKPEALEWIKEVDSTPLAQMWNDVRCSFNAFFRNMRSKKKKFVNPPKFKSRKNPKDGFRYSSVASVHFKGNKLWITRKVGLLEGSFSCRFCEGRVKTTTIKRTATGKWFVKICVEKRDEKKCENGRMIGIDWNCKDESFLTMSDGTRVKCPRLLRKKQKHLSHLQKIQSKRYKIGAEKQSGHYERAKYAVARCHEKVADARKDWLHKLSRSFANQYQYVIVEDINLQTMASGLHHGKVIGDQGFGMLRSQIAYKATLIKVNPAYTSQTCHVCGNRNSKLTLGDREWKCSVCGTLHDRDINAAVNILIKGQQLVGLEATEITNASGVPRSTVKLESPKPSARSAINLRNENDHAA
jgi:putative transposase